MRFTGTLKTWNDERGFGFLEPAQGGQEIFVHIKAFPSGTGRPSIGQLLTFEVETGSNGNKKARAVQYAVRGKQSQRPRTESPAPWTMARIVAIPAFVTIYAFVVWRWGSSPPVLLAYLGLESRCIPSVRVRQVCSGIWPLANRRANASSFFSCWWLAWSTGCATNPTPQDK